MKFAGMLKKKRPDMTFEEWVAQAKGEDAYAREAGTQSEMMPAHQPLGPSFPEWVNQARGQDAYAREAQTQGLGRPSPFGDWLSDASGQAAYAREAQSQGLQDQSFGGWVDEARGQDAYGREAQSQGLGPARGGDPRKRALIQYLIQMLQQGGL